MANESLDWHNVPVPDHVPAGLVYDFDYISDPELFIEPHERLLRLQAEAPQIFFTRRNGGHWVIIGYEALVEAARKTDIFSSAQPEVNGFKPPVLLPLMVDPPVHKVYRAPLNEAFNPNSMLNMEQDIRVLARDLIDKVADDGGCEFIEAIAEPLPVTIFLKMMGMPLERLGEFRAVIKTGFTAGPSTDGGVLKTIAEIMSEFVIARRTDPKDDLISRLWALEVDGRAITFEEMMNYCLLLYVAGLDTVVNAMGYAIRHLAKYPELQRTLREDTKRIPVASEEMLRRYGIVSSPRLVARDCVFEGVPLRTDDRVLMLLPAGNFDSSKFKDAAKYSLERPSISHLTFNAGPHRCVGAHLARVELRVLYEEWLARIPEFRLDPDHPAVFRPGNIITVCELPILWN